jgi:hypothetical protein
MSGLFKKSKMVYKKIDFDEAETMELVETFSIEKIYQPDANISLVLNKIVIHCQQALGLPSNVKYRITGKSYSREEGNIIPSTTDTTIISRAVVNVNSRDIYGTTESQKDKKPSTFHLMTSGDLIVIPQKYCSEVSVIVDKKPMQKVKIGGREIAVLRPKSHKRITILIDYLSTPTTQQTQQVETNSDTITYQI